MSSLLDPRCTLRAMTLAQVRRRRRWATVGFWGGGLLLIFIFAALVGAVMLLPVMAVLCGIYAHSALMSSLFFGVVAVLVVMAASLGPWLGSVERRLIHLRELRQRERLLVRKLDCKLPLKGTLCLSASPRHGELKLISPQSTQGSLTICPVSEP